MNKLKIFFFGDSITYGVGDIRGSGFVDKIKSHYSLGIKGYNVVDVYNLGINWNTSLDLSRRIADEMAARQKDDIQVDRQLVIIYIGANDYAQGVDLLTFRLNLEAIVNSALNFVSKSDIALFGLYEHETSGDYSVEDYNDVIEDVATDYDLNFISNPISEDDLSDDGIHPNSDAHDILAKNVIIYIEDKLK